MREFSDFVSSLHRAVHAFSLFFERSLAGEVTQAEAIVLLYLSSTRSSTINDVHAAFLHKRSTLTSIVDRLQARGLVERRISENDRRNYMLVLTREGRAAARQLAEAVASLQRTLGVSRAAINSATSALRATVAAMHGRI